MTDKYFLKHINEFDTDKLRNIYTQCLDLNVLCASQPSTRKIEKGLKRMYKLMDAVEEEMKRRNRVL